jgi:hypothetical protein
MLGGCLCGDVRYRVAGEPSASGICHCRTCRKAASAPTLPFIVFSAGQLVFTQGEPTKFRSSAGVTRSFCGRCGSPLTYRSEESPERVDVMTCSLDAPEAYPPQFHVWVSHKLEWTRLDNELPAYSEKRERRH